MAMAYGWLRSGLIMPHRHFWKRPNVELSRFWNPFVTKTRMGTSFVQVFTRMATPYTCLSNEANTQGHFCLVTRRGNQPISLRRWGCNTSITWLETWGGTK